MRLKQLTVATSLAFACIAAESANAGVMAILTFTGGGRILFTDETSSCPAGTTEALYTDISGKIGPRGCWEPLEGTIDFRVKWENGLDTLYDLRGIKTTDYGKRALAGK